MADKLTKTEIVKLILDEDMDIIQEDEEIINILLDKKVSKNIDTKESLSYGDKVADKVAAVAGSWRFIISFCVILIIWIIINGVILSKSFDPYPFILLNLILSCVAALQAPLIMMSQNRQENKDRMRAENDYKVNLKAEIIIEDLHEKIEKLIANQERILLQISASDNTEQKK